MNYPEFNSVSIISLMVSLCSLVMVIFFVRIVVERIKKAEYKLSSLIRAFNNLRGDYVTRARKETKKETISYMEGDIDLVKEGKKATFKAIYYPKKINRKRD